MLFLMNQLNTIAEKQFAPNFNNCLFLFKRVFQK